MILVQEWKLEAMFPYIGQTIKYHRYIYHSYSSKNKPLKGMLIAVACMKIVNSNLHYTHCTGDNNNVL